MQNVNYRYAFGAVVVLMLSCVTAFGQDGLSLMKVDPCARPSGMGGAFVSVAGDPNIAVYNPAGATFMKHFSATFSHVAYWENIRMENAFFASPLTGRWYVEGGIRFSTVSDLQMRQAPVTVPDALFDAHDISFKAGLAYRFSDRISAGVAGGWFVEKIESWSGHSFDADLGVLATPMEHLNVGASVTNLGGDFSLGKQGQVSSRPISLPTTYRLGSSYTYRNYLCAADLVVLDKKGHLHLGAEAKLQEMFKVRAGYMFGYDTKNFTAGVSFTRRNLTIDYGFVPYSNDLGTSHLFNFTFSR